MPAPAQPTNNLRIQNREVRTIVIPGSNKSDSFASLNEILSASLSDLLSSVPANGVVPLDIQSHYAHPYLWSSTQSPVAGTAAALTLCAVRFCLVIHLFRASLAALQRDYGLTRRNAVDLGRLAASLRQKPHLKAFGLAALAKGAGVGDVSFKLAAKPWFADWSVERLSAEQVESAANQAFLTFRVANKLLDGGDIDK